MKRMRILSVKSIPRFIGEYFNKKLIDIKTINEFSKLLPTIEFDCFKNENRYYGYLSYTPELIKFYKDKSELDHYYRCKYEDELGLPKSVSNEIYSVQLDNNEIINVTLLYDFKFNILILNVE